MKIFFITPWYPNPRFPLEGSFVESQALALSRQGVDVKVASLHLSPFEVLKPVRQWYRSYRTEEKGLAVVKIEGPFLPKRTKIIIQAWAQLVSRLLLPTIKKERNVSLLHAHTQLGAIAAYFLSQKTGIPYVVTLHESSFLENKTASWHKALLEPALTSASHVFCVSDALKKSVGTQFKSIPFLSALPNNIDVSLFFPLKERPAFPPFHWIAIGDLKPIKQFDLLIQAFKKMTEAEKDSFRLTIIGYGPERKKLEEMTLRLNLQNLVHFRGYLSPEDIPHQLHQAHALALSSRTETFGIVLAEALACGLPVLATDCGGPRDIIGPEQGLIVSEQTAEAIAAGMMAIYRTYDSFDAGKLHEYAASRFSDEVVVEKIKAVYEKI